MKDNQAWAFLVGCNQYLDYRIIVAPSFICESKTSSLLAIVAGGKLSEVGTAYYREIHNSKVGDLTLVFRVIEATSENTRIEGQGILKDTFGRDLILVEGIVFRGLHSDIIVTQENLDKVHQEILVDYQKFWNCTTSQPATSSGFLEWFEHSEKNNCLKYIKLQEYHINSKKLAGKYTNNYKQSWISRRFKEYDGEIDSVTYLPNQQIIIYRYHRKVMALSFDHMALSFDHKDFRQLCVERKLIFGDCLCPIAVSQDGKFMATGIIEGRDQNIVKVWDIENIWSSKKDEIVEPILNLESSSLVVMGNTIFGRIHTLAFSPDSQTIVSAGAENIIYVWDINSGSKLDERHEHSSSIRAIAISPNGQYMISGDDHGIINFWNWTTKQLINSIHAKLPIRALAFSPNSKIFTSGSDNQKVKIWDSKNREEICILGEHSDSVNSVTFSSDGKTIATASDDCTIKLWDVQERKKIDTLKGHTKGVTSVSFSPNGRTIVSGSRDKTIRLWEKI